MTSEVLSLVNVETVYGSIARELCRLGVRRVFGLMGEDTASLAAALVSSGAAYTPARHEAAAVAMADGYAWGAGETGVAVISRGPGLTNAATAARTAVLGRRDVLIICGAAPVSGGWSPDPKALDQQSTAEALGLGYVEARSAEEVVAALHAALGACRAGRASVLAVASDVLNGQASSTEMVGRASEGLPISPARAPAASEVTAVADMLCACARPLILAGRGAVEADARRALEVLARQAGALLGTTMLAKDLFRGHPSDIGVVGGFASDPARPILDDVDGVVAFGASLNSFTAMKGRLAQGRRIAQIDRDPEALGRNLPIELGVSADARLTADAVLEALRKRAGAPDGPAPGVVGPLYSGPDESLADQLDPRVAARVLDERLPPNSTIVLDGGGNMGFAGRFVRVSGPDRFRLSTDFGSVGMGLGVAIGVATARPNAPTILWVGDGGLVMGLGDLETVARCQVPLTTIVMNDGAFGAERHVLKRAGLPEVMAEYAPVDLAGVARSFGIDAYSITTIEELAERIDGIATDHRPTLLDCKIRPDIRGIDQ